jgi:hypothetical protein
MFKKEINYMIFYRPCEEVMLNQHTVACCAKRSSSVGEYINIYSYPFIYLCSMVFVRFSGFSTYAKHAATTI